MRIHWSFPTITAGAIIGAALYYSVPAGADPDPVLDYATRNAGRVCATLDRYPTLAGVDGLLDAVQQDSGFSDHDTGRAVGLAVNNICPKHADLLQRYAYAVTSANGGVVV
ncbi:DUF732 domain-containing protein [Mycobacterium marinum]|uniref:DUF732 domain-containing protein n=1 Tax=Mycobacterium marinum TaxID=1781 RepID=UPI003563B932